MLQCLPDMAERGYAVRIGPRVRVMAKLPVTGRQLLAGHWRLLASLSGELLLKHGLFAGTPGTPWCRTLVDYSVSAEPK